MPTGTRGLLKGSPIAVTPEIREGAALLHRFGGSPIGNSRVKLTNVEDCVQRGLVAEGENPLEVAARQLTVDGVDVLHTIGGDDTNTTGPTWRRSWPRTTTSSPSSACPRPSTTTSSRSSRAWAP